MDILVTGGSGWLGSQLVRRLVSMGIRVIVPVRQSTDLYRLGDLLGNRNLAIVPLGPNGDTTDAFSIFENKVRIVVHTATNYGRGVQRDISTVIESNLVFPTNLLMNAIKNGVELFINTDSYFNKPQHSFFSLPDYSLSKKAFLEWLIYESDKIRIVNMRLEHVFGPEDNGSKFVPALLRGLLDPDVRSIPMTNGFQKRDFIYSSDVVETFRVLIESYEELPAKGFTEYEIGTGTSTSVREFAELAQRLSGSYAVLGFGDLPTRQDEISDSKANHSFRKQFKFDTHYDLETSLIRTINSYSSNSKTTNLRAQ